MTDIVARFIEKEEQRPREYDALSFESSIGTINISLEDYAIPHQGFKYVIRINKGAISEFRPFFTHFFAKRYFKKLERRYRTEK